MELRQQLIDDTKRDAETKGIAWDDLIERARLPKATKSRLNHGQASLKTIEKLKRILDGDEAAHEAQRTGPKGGPARPITDEWRKKVHARLEELGWTPAELAREVEKLTGEPMTRSGIAHVLTKAVRSGLVVAIQKATGFDPEELTMPRPGVSWPVSDEWRQAVIDALREKNWNRAELARRLKCSRTAITDILGDAQKSTLVPEVERLLGLPSSVPVTKTEPQVRANGPELLIAVWEQLNEFDRGRLLGWAETLRRK